VGVFEAKQRSLVVVELGFLCFDLIAEERIGRVYWLSSTGDVGRGVGRGGMSRDSRSAAGTGFKFLEVLKVTGFKLEFVVESTSFDLKFVIKFTSLEFDFREDTSITSI